MDPLQLSALKTIMSGPRPRVVWQQVDRVAAATISPVVPKVSGLLCIQAIFNRGGTATPGTPTGFTSLTSAAATASDPGVRVAYKFLNGSEARAIASAAASSTEMAAVSYLIAGCCPAYVPQAGQSLVSGVTFVTPALTGVAGGSGRLWILAGMLQGTNVVEILPPFPQWTWDRLITVQGTDRIFGAHQNSNLRIIPSTGNEMRIANAGDHRITLINVRGG